MCTTPKVPKPTPVVERQAYKSPVSREALAGQANPDRARIIAGVATSTQGVTGPASTTKRVLTGGDQPLMPVLSTPSSPAVIPLAPPVPVGGVRGVQAGRTGTPSSRGRVIASLGASRQRLAMTAR